MITAKIRNEIFVGSDIVDVAQQAYGENVHVHYESNGGDIKRIAWVGNYRAGEIIILSTPEKVLKIYVDDGYLSLDFDED